MKSIFLPKKDTIKHVYMCLYRYVSVILKMPN